jgi:serine/threonine-protein kinase
MSEDPGLAGPALALRLEQARRWRQGDRAPAEEYLARHPALAADPEYALEVVYGELLLREEQGERPGSEEFLRRFPQFADRLRRLFDLHTAVRSACLLESDGAVAQPQETLLSQAGAATTPLPPARLGYELRQELGRGGMGVVLACRDSALGRDLAVKALRPEHRGDPAAQRRFLEEAQITGQLQHPGVVPVHHVGRLPDGRPYFAMKLVRGQTLADLLEARADPGQELPRFLAVFRQVCQAVAYAHSKGVLHRDLKPANIMVGAFDEVQVMDWGLAKVLGGAAGGPAADRAEIRTLRAELPEAASRTGAVLGTPAYMAPEQARGEVAALDERCDVFGLGAILCEMLTGRPPYEAKTVEEICRQAAQGDLGEARARLAGCGADGELVGLARRCLAAEAAGRPRDAGEVARAVTAHLASVQERLRRAELERAAAQARARAERQARRRTVVAAVAALALLALGGGGWWWWHQRAAAATRAVEVLLDQVDPLMREGQWPAALAVARQADALLATGGVPTELRQRVRERLADAEMVVRLEERYLHVKRKHGHYDASDSANYYAQVFRDYGIDVVALEPAEAAERIRQRAIRDYLVATLEAWARLGHVDPPLRERLVTIADKAADEDWRATLRAAREATDGQALQKLADSVEVGRRSPEALLQLSSALEREGNNAAALSLLRRAQQQYPGHFSVDYQLLTLLRREKPVPWDDLFRLATTTLALRNANPAMHLEVGAILEQKGRLDEAMAAYREGIRLEPEFDPAHHDLGRVLEKKGQLDRAIDAYREAIRLRPWVADYHNALGVVFTKSGRVDEAVAALKEAIRLAPDWSDAHLNLGLALARQGRSDEAATAFQEAIRACSGDDAALVRVGTLFYQQGRPDDAMIAYREAIRLQPNNHWAHGLLANVLEKMDRLDEAIVAYRQAIRLAPDLPAAHFDLATALRKKGEFAESLAEFRRGHELILKTQPETHQYAESLHNAERLAELDARLPAIVRGSARPADAAERIELGNLCLLKKRPAAAARFFEEALRERPALAEDLKTSNRYNTACAAALAGCGQGQDGPPLDGSTRSRWREQALAWLRADLTAWTKQLAGGKPEARAEVRQQLEHWQRDPDLAGLRDEAALAMLPEAERTACRQLWAEVQKLLDQARANP